MKTVVSEIIVLQPVRRKRKSTVKAGASVKEKN